jgi:hypothetical protein
MTYTYTHPAGITLSSCDAAHLADALAAESADGF